MIVEFKTRVYVSGDGDYDTYRIPAIVRLPDGVLLAFCEGRRDDESDAGAIDILVRRSEDRGRTWSDIRVVVDGMGDTAGNPTPVVDRTSGDVLVIFCMNDASAAEERILSGEMERSVWLTRSGDQGVTWSTPVELSDQVKRRSWTWYATGPCHGVQLQNGRIVVPANHVDGPAPLREPDKFRSHVLFSDDGGSTWSIGAVAEPRTNECTLAEIGPSELYLNCRSYGGGHARGAGRLVDGGQRIERFWWDSTLYDAPCQGSVLSLWRAGVETPALFFSGPSGEWRSNLAIWRSDDNGSSWRDPVVVHAGPSTYSDMVADVPSDGFYYLYEEGERNLYEAITFASISVD